MTKMRMMMIVEYLTSTWVVAQDLALALQLGLAVQIQGIGGVVFPVGGVAPIEHVVRADVDEEYAG